MLSEVRNDAAAVNSRTTLIHSFIQITNNIPRSLHPDPQINPKRLSFGRRSIASLQADEEAELMANSLLAQEMFSLDRDRQFEEAILAREFAEAEVGHACRN